MKGLSMKRYECLLIIFLLASVPSLTIAASPLQTVETKVNQLLDVLKSNANKTQKESRIRNLADEFFDFELLSKLTLSRNWQKLNSEQKKEFIKLYRKLLEDTYMKRLLEYKDEKVNYGKEIFLNHSIVRYNTISKRGSF